jgi:predicted amidohydrolase YtcJ
MGTPNHPRRVAALAAAVSLTVVAPAAAATPADTVWHHGRVFTSDARGTVAQAVAVRGGRVVYVGSDRGAQRLIGKRTAVTDLRGRMAMPGLVDGHMHPLGGGQGLLKCSLNYEPLTKEQIRTRIAACLKDTAAKGPHAWLEVTSWYQEAMLPAGTKLTAADLDDLSPTRPITVQSSFFHSTVANSTAMRLAGITAATKDPAGGSIDRDAQGAPTGLFNDEAQGLVTAKIPAPTAAENVEAAKAALKAMREQGVTSFLDAAASPDSLAAFRSVRRAGGLTARAHFAPVVQASAAKDPAKVVAGLRAVRRGFDEGPTAPRPGITVRNAKVFMDGVQQFPAFTAGLLKPYLVDQGTPGHPHFVPGPSRGPLYVQPAPLKRLLAAIGNAGFDPHVHSIGDRAVRVTLDAVAAMRKVTKSRDIRPAIAHAEMVDPADYGRFAKLGVQPVMSYQWAKPGPDSIDAQKAYLGFERWNRIEPEDSLRKAQASIAYGSDWPVDPLNEWFALQVGVTRENPAGGKYAGRFNAQKPLPRAYALRSITASGSYELHQDDTGTIAPGQLADMIVLDRDFLRTKATRLKDTKVLTTMVGGRTVYQAPSAR